MAKSPSAQKDLPLITETLRAGHCAPALHCRKAAKLVNRFAFQVLLLHYHADLYAREEEYAEAEDYFQRALTLWQQTQSPVQHPSHPSRME